LQKQQRTLLGAKNVSRISEQKLIDDRTFYWIVEDVDEKEEKKLIKRLARAESTMKTIFRQVVKIVDWVNKMEGKTNKGYEWMKRAVKKKFQKKYGGDGIDLDNILCQKHDKPQYIELTDREYFEKEFLPNQLINVERL